MTWYSCNRFLCRDASGSGSKSNTCCSGFGQIPQERDLANFPHRYLSATWPKVRKSQKMYFGMACLLWWRHESMWAHNNRFQPQWFQPFKYWTSLLFRSTLYLPFKLTNATCLWIVSTGRNSMILIRISLGRSRRFNPSGFASWRDGWPTGTSSESWMGLQDLGKTWSL